MKSMANTNGQKRSEKSSQLGYLLFFSSMLCLLAATMDADGSSLKLGVKLAAGIVGAVVAGASLHQFGKIRRRQ